MNEIRDGLGAFGSAVINACDHESAFRHKIEKHRNDPRKLAIYLCYRYSSQDPNEEFNDVFRGEKEPILEHIKKDIPAMTAIERIKAFGWKVKVGAWPNTGNQLIVVKPDGKCFHSEFIWTK